MMHMQSEPLLAVNSLDEVINFQAHTAAKRDDVTALRGLPRSACQSKRDGMLPLHRAAAHSALPAMDFLLSLPGSSADEGDDAGKTPLMHAVAARAEEAVVWLVRQTKNLDALDERGRAASHWAAYLGSCSMISLLVNLGKFTIPW